MIAAETQSTMVYLYSLPARKSSLNTEIGVSGVLSLEVLASRSQD